MDLPGLSEFNKTRTPSSLEVVYFLFWEKGISLKELEELPIPYIVSIVNTYTYVKDLEAKAAKKKR
jgi:hypothetical protein